MMVQMLTPWRYGPLPAAARTVPPGMRLMAAPGYPCRGRDPGIYGMSPLA